MELPSQLRSWSVLIHAGATEVEVVLGVVVEDEFVVLVGDVSTWAASEQSGGALPTVLVVWHLFQLSEFNLDQGVIVSSLTIAGSALLAISEIAGKAVEHLVIFVSFKVNLVSFLSTLATLKVSTITAEATFVA